MNILHINEQLSHSLTSKMDCYKLDTYSFGMQLTHLADGNGRDKLQLLSKCLSTKNIKLLILDEPSSKAFVILTDNTIEDFDLKIMFNAVLDLVMEESNGKVIRLNKTNWEKQCKRLDLQRVKYKTGKMTVVRGLEGDYGKRLQYNFIDNEVADKFLLESPGIIGNVLELYAKKVEHFILWEESNVFALKLADGKYICFNCNKETYERIRNVLWKELQQIALESEN